MKPLKKINLAVPAFFLALLLLILIQFIFFATGNDQNSDDDREIVIHYVDNLATVQYKIISKFNEEYKGKIRVELSNLPLYKFSTHERKQLLIKYLRSKSPMLDIFSLDLVWIARFARWAEDLNKYLTPDELKQVEDLALNSCYYQNKQVALPVYLDIGTMFYRKEDFRGEENTKLREELKSGITWEKFISLGKSSRFSGKPFYTFWADNYEGLMCSFAEMMISKYGPGGEELFLDRQNLGETVHFITGLVHSYKISPPEITGLQENNFIDYYFNNNGVFLRGWPTTIGEYYPSWNKNDPGIMERAPLPHFAEGKKAYIRGGWNMMISRYSTKKEAAIEFLRFWMREENQSLMYEENGYLPSLKTFYYDGRQSEKYETLSYYNELFKHSAFRPVSENYQAYSQIITQYIKAAIDAEMTAEEAVERIYNEINELRGEK